MGIRDRPADSSVLNPLAFPRAGLGQSKTLPASGSQGPAEGVRQSWVTKTSLDRNQRSSLNTSCETGRGWARRGHAAVYRKFEACISRPNGRGRDTSFSELNVHGGAKGLKWLQKVLIA